MFLGFIIFVLGIYNIVLGFYNIFLGFPKNFPLPTAQGAPSGLQPTTFAGSSSENKKTGMDRDMDKDRDPRFLGYYYFLGN